MANKTKIRWYLYRQLKKRDLISPRRGGYSLKQLMNFIHAYYNVDLTVFQERHICKAFMDLTDESKTWIDNHTHLIKIEA